MKIKFREGKVIKMFEAGGKKIIFRYPKMSDVDGLLSYINSLVEEEARILLTEKMTMKKEIYWLKNSISENKIGHNITVVAECYGKIAGIAGINKRSPNKTAGDHVAEIHFGIKKEYRKLGIGEALAKISIELARKKWRIEMIRSSYVSDNIPSARLHKKLGFKITGRIPNGVKYGNKYFDDIIV